MLASMLKCESTTPLGSPVLPLLKMIVAVSLTVTALGAPANRSIQRTGAASASSGGDGPIGRADPGHQVLGVDQLESRRRLELRLLEEGPAGDDRPEPRLLGGGLHPGPAGGEVQVDGGAAGQRRGQVDQRAAHARRQQEADGRLALPSRPQGTRPPPGRRPGP